MRKHFKTNVETAITSPVDAQAAIIRYQDVVQNASSEINFSFGEGLVMAPGDLLLRIGKIVGYNNNIIVATSAQRLGLNKGLNKSVAPPPPPPPPPDSKPVKRGSLYRWAPIQRRPPASTQPPQSRPLLQQRPQTKQTTRLTRTKKQPSSWAVLPSA